MSDETSVVEEDVEEVEVEEGGGGGGVKGIAFLLGDVTDCWPSREEGEVDETPSLHFMGMKVSGFESRTTCRS